MNPGAYRATLAERLTNLVTRLFLFGLLGVVVMTLFTYSAVHHTAQPEFCNTCHIMEPYYRSWQESSHANVPCIECHYEPGAVETLEGKFKALSQLAKYVTRTQGTKPWAEVSDASCMRSGCHSVRMLEGPVSFGSIQFDHRHHLLESRRGRRLRCVTCHSQIVQGEHVSVTPEVCITCHFMPDEHGERPPIGDCLLCHGPPEHPVEVDGRPFVHADYVERGVACTECHDPVVEGDGRVRKERCHSCHAEVGHIERIGETEFLHETHVTNHKVECFECHDRIEHGLLDLPEVEPDPEDACASCHTSPHRAVVQVYSGQGAHGVEENPSRMYRTRVVCRACHTGRSGAHVLGTLVDGDGSAGPQRRWSSVSQPPPEHAVAVPAAGNVDCVHCHGVEFDGMLDRWQASVRAALDRVGAGLQRLEEALASEDGSDTARRLAREARANLELVVLDGSEGAHNVTYVLSTLRAAAERIDAAFRELGRSEETAVAAAVPAVSEHGCTSCHAGVETVTARMESGIEFPHGPHLLGAALDCAECHDPGVHGRTTLDAASCASCHHDEERVADPYDCGRCHAPQAALLAGEVAGGPSLPSVMADLDCTECHGEPPDVMRPQPKACVICHEPGFASLAETWAERVRERLEQLSSRVEALASNGALSAADRQEVEGLLGAVRADPGAWAHNVHLALERIRRAEGALEEAARRAGVRLAPSSPPLRTSVGGDCGRCHVDVLSLQAELPNGREFSHARHLAEGGLSCTACHSAEQHGEPAFPREDCGACHHTDTGPLADRDCESCHTFEAGLLRGELPEFPDEEAPHADLDCALCHGEPPEVKRRNEQVCRVCHGADFVSEDLDALRRELRGLGRRIEERLTADPVPGESALESARRALELLRRDASLGVHDAFLVRGALEQAADALGVER